MKKISIFLKLILMIICAALLGTILMISVYFIPVEPLTESVSESIDLYVHGINNWSGSNVDSSVSNFADSLMLNMVTCRVYDSDVKNAMLSPFKIYDDSNYQQGYLIKSMRGEPEVGIKNYSRYWHGYMVWLIPLLVFFNVSEIRIIASMVLFVLMGTVLFQMKKVSNLYMCIYGAMILLLNPISVAMSFNMSHIFVLALFFSWIAVRYEKQLIKDNGYICLFTLSGISVAFFDFFTYPIAAYGIPMCVVVVLSKDGMKSFERMVKCSFAWILGYGGMWCSKWVIGTLLTGENLITNGIGNVEKWVVRNDVAATPKYMDIVKQNIQVYFQPHMKLIFILLLLIIVVWCVKNHWRPNLNVSKGMQLLSIFIVGLSPFVWHYVVLAHCRDHQTFHYRTFVVFVFALLSAIYIILYPKEEKTGDRVIAKEG